MHSLVQLHYMNSWNRICSSDIDREKQSTLPSKIDQMKGLTIEMTFEYPVVDGAKCLEWYRGRIIKLSNEKNQCKN